MLVNCSLANRVYGNQLSRKRQQLLRHARDLQSLQFETRRRHQEVEEDIASHFNQMLDELRVDEEQKLKAIRELKELCECEVRTVDSIGSRLQSMRQPVVAISSAGTEGVAAVSRDLMDKMQKVS